MKPIDRAAKKIDRLGEKAKDRESQRVGLRDGGLFAAASAAVFCLMTVSGWAAGRTDSDVGGPIVVTCGVVFGLGVVAYRIGLRPESYYAPFGES